MMDSTFYQEVLTLHFAFGRLLVTVTHQSSSIIIITVRMLPKMFLLKHRTTEIS